MIQHVCVWAMMWYHANTLMNHARTTPTLTSRRRKATYTKGEINTLIDGLFHPLMHGEDKVQMMLLDAGLHALVEQNPTESFLKFMRFTVPGLVDEITKQNEAGSRRRRTPSRRR